MRQYIDPEPSLRSSQAASSADDVIMEPTTVNDTIEKSIKASADRDAEWARSRDASTNTRMRGPIQQTRAQSRSRSNHNYDQETDQWHAPYPAWRDAGWGESTWQAPSNSQWNTSRGRTVVNVPGGKWVWRAAFAGSWWNAKSQSTELDETTASHNLLVVMTVVFTMGLFLGFMMNKLWSSGRKMNMDDDEDNSDDEFKSKPKLENDHNVETNVIYVTDRSLMYIQGSTKKYHTSINCHRLKCAKNYKALYLCKVCGKAD